jgi:hypothetical protein
MRVLLFVQKCIAADVEMSMLYDLMMHAHRLLLLLLLLTAANDEMQCRHTTAKSYVEPQPLPPVPDLLLLVVAAAALQLQCSHPTSGSQDQL